MGRASAAFLAAGWLAFASPGRAEPPDFSKTKPPPGRTFKTNQDKVSYALCQAGDKKHCANVHYNEGPLPTSPGKAAPAARAPSARDNEADAPGGREAAAERARADGDKAMSRARGLGEELKKDLREGEGAAPGGAQPGRAPGGIPSDRDLLAASYAGYGASLSALGLVVGRDESGRPALRRADGSPATAEDLAALQARIAAEPAALMRRPDFFSAIPRVRFEELKQAYRSRPELRAGVFRDVGLNELPQGRRRPARGARLPPSPPARRRPRRGFRGRGPRRRVGDRGLPRGGGARTGRRGRERGRVGAHGTRGPARARAPDGRRRRGAGERGRAGRLRRGAPRVGGRAGGRRRRARAGTRAHVGRGRGPARRRRPAAVAPLYLKEPVSRDFLISSAV
ncbi:MAG: hypothetical protein HYX59_00360 [Elusimicrobia bacterium]|nr:hypothetical protein [Elusimicrobiota bacterium]